MEKGPGRISCSISSSRYSPQALDAFSGISPVFLRHLVESAEKSLQVDIKLPLHVQPPWTSYSLASHTQHPSVSPTMPAKVLPVPRMPAPGKQVLMALSAGTCWSLALQLQSSCPVTKDPMDSKHSHKLAAFQLLTICFVLF